MFPFQFTCTFTADHLSHVSRCTHTGKVTKNTSTIKKKKKLSGFALPKLPYFLGSRSLRTHNLKSGEKERTNN